jgi:hypothetical protein
MNISHFITQNFKRPAVERPLLYKGHYTDNILQYSYFVDICLEFFSFLLPKLFSLSCNAEKLREEQLLLPEM